jgi:hypothetical protein
MTSHQAVKKAHLRCLCPWPDRFLCFVCIDKVSAGMPKISAQAAQKDLRGEARERSTSGGVLWWYVGARRLSATKHMSLFQQPAVSFAASSTACRIFV